MSALLGRELRLAYRQRAELLQPLVFSLLVVVLFVLGIGPGPQTLQKVGGGILWVTAILSSLLGMERLFRDDFLDGWLEQLCIAPASLTWAALQKVMVHWLVTILPLLLLSPLLALFLNLSWPMYWALVATLLLGTPILSLVGAIAVALTLGVQKSAALLPLLLLPVFTPLLIFATAALEAAALGLSYRGQLAILAAMLLLTLALAPMAIAYALKVSID